MAKRGVCGCCKTDARRRCRTVSACGSASSVEMEMEMETVPAAAMTQLPCLIRCRIRLPVAAVRTMTEAACTPVTTHRS